MHALVEGGADVRAVDEQGLSALLNAVKVGGPTSIIRQNFREKTTNFAVQFRLLSTNAIFK